MLTALQALFEKGSTIVITENHSTKAFPQKKNHHYSYLATVLTTYRKARKCKKYQVPRSMFKRHS